MSKWVREDDDNAEDENGYPEGGEADETFRTNLCHKQSRRYVKRHLSWRHAEEKMMRRGAMTAGPGALLPSLCARTAPVHHSRRRRHNRGPRYPFPHCLLILHLVALLFPSRHSRYPTPTKHLEVVGLTRQRVYVRPWVTVSAKNDTSAAPPAAAGGVTSVAAWAPGGYVADDKIFSDKSSDGEGEDTGDDDSGGAVQVDPIKSKLKPPGTNPLKLKLDVLLSTSAFNFNLRRYTAVYVCATMARHTPRTAAPPHPPAPVAATTTPTTQNTTPAAAGTTTRCSTATHPLTACPDRE